MTMLTITAWKKKLVWIAAAVAVVCVLGVLLLFISGGETQGTQGPQPDSLQKEVLQQPIRV
jgi:hypothetical protein